MIGPHLETAEHWELWLELLGRWPGREATLAARVSMLAERDWGGHRDGVVLAMAEAERIERALEQVAIPPTRRPRSWGRVAGWAAAAGLLLTLTPRPVTDAPALRTRGLAVQEIGVVRLEQARRTLGRVVVGQGLRPGVRIGTTPLTARFQPAPGGPPKEIWAYVVGEEGLDPVPVDPTALLDPVGDTLVVLILDPGTDPARAAREAGDGRGTVLTGSTLLVAFDLDLEGAP